MYSSRVMSGSYQSILPVRCDFTKPLADNIFKNVASVVYAGLGSG